MFMFDIVTNDFSSEMQNKEFDFVVNLIWMKETLRPLRLSTERIFNPYGSHRSNRIEERHEEDILCHAFHPALIHWLSCAIAAFDGSRRQSVSVDSPHRRFASRDGLRRRCE